MQFRIFSYNMARFLHITSSSPMHASGHLKNAPRLLVSDSSSLLPRSFHNTTRHVFSSLHPSSSMVPVSKRSSLPSSSRRIFSTDTKADPNSTTPPQPDQQAPAEDSTSTVRQGAEVDAGAGAPPSSTNVEKLLATIKEQEEMVKALKDRSLRAYAEMENVRRIAKNDVDNARQYGVTGFAKEVVEVADNLERALNAVPEQVLKEESESSHLATLKILYEGIKATEAQLAKVLEFQGIVKYGAVGDKFDPKIHQAMFEAPVPGTEPGYIIQLMKAGYTIKDRNLRPAHVGVSKAQ